MDDYNIHLIPSMFENPLVYTMYAIFLKWYWKNHTSIYHDISTKTICLLSHILFKLRNNIRFNFEIDNTCI